MKHKPIYKVKTTAATIQAAIIGYVRSGVTIKQIVKLVGVSVLDVEAVIINNKLSVKPETCKVTEWTAKAPVPPNGYIQKSKGNTIITDYLTNKKG